MLFGQSYCVAFIVQKEVTAAAVRKVGTKSHSPPVESTKIINSIGMINAAHAAMMHDCAQESFGVY